MPSILITGASGGIGAAVAARYLDEGWTVGLVARRAEKLAEVAAGRAGAVVLPADVTDAAAVARVFAEFIDRAGRLDVLFNNAGIFTPPAPIDEIPLADWRAALAVNLDAMFLCAREAFGQMRRQSPQGGRIIN
ncbi:MAG: SDR family oxidoreductase, partial [Maritimibacter sp.]|nr:SDR family oxidoreductase [Maritimibacter sp.]